MPRRVLGFDVGGSTVKAGCVDVGRGELVGELLVEPTPQPATPEAVLRTIAALCRRLPAARARIGVAIPCVVKRGVARTAANVDAGWLGLDVAAAVGRMVGRAAAVLNDADAAGLAEMRWGAGRGERGPVLMLTFGTGIGSALFVGGELFPNTELGHMELKGMDAEKWASAHVRTALALDWPAWASRVNDYLERMNALLWPDLIVLGGSVTENYEHFAPLLRCEAELRRAQFTGQAGVIGAALAASMPGTGARPRSLARGPAAAVRSPKPAGKPRWPAGGKGTATPARAVARTAPRRSPRRAARKARR